MGYVTLDDLNQWKREVSAIEAAQIARRVLVYECGIPRAILDRCHDPQRRENWCWAAVVETVLRYYGVEKITQEDVVRRTFGHDLPDRPAPPETMAANLNGWHPQQDGSTVAIYARFFAGEPLPLVYLAELRDRRNPLILFRAGTPVGHVLLATGLHVDADGNIKRIIVRDPAEDAARGRRPLRSDEMIVGFFVVQAMPSVDWP